ncbi:MAG: leucine-rich repeat domain-containing protein [Sulfurimonas sp.]|uniref:leucine-rich repeat domain-containing protein n=1 Tax=Sulfurimonas sp. TaxID=2022749 RepID=UPI00262E9B63|nr:leucine-rich repeat domain-containing protein [Sulfurimonas sp.]MDD2651641.1 leucine-rich repeat domain-containing protein [Sulfurimonas sp.]MDD3451452.1 leucine-rich repeat domain-containing protein [Sulfurimonas sp.]
MEAPETINIDTNWWQGESRININDLCKIEISIIASMFQSKELFSKITESINEENFTFFVTRKIFSHLKSYSDEVDYFGNEDEKTNIAEELYAFENIFTTTTLRILDSKPIKNIDLELAEFLDFSNKRLEVFEPPLEHSNNGKHYSNIIIEDEYGQYASLYYNGIVKEIFTTYIFHLPEELCDTFKHTFEKIAPYAQKENFNLAMEINENDPKDIRAFVLIKNINKIKKLKNLIAWGKENDIKQNIFPRNRAELLGTIVFELNDQNLEYIPDEFCEVLSEVRFLTLLNNHIKEIPKNINSLKNCILLMLCNNQIKFLPETLFQLNKLTVLCLHGNAIQEIPEEIGNLVELNNLILSNNSIDSLPSTVSKLIKLKELDIENTLIDESSLKYVNLENIEKISFDDRLLPFFVKNLHRLKEIDTINLVHSQYKKSDEIISSLGLNHDDEKWMEDKDYKGHGCIVLSKHK